MKKSEYVKIRFSNIPQEFVDEYNLQEYTNKNWVYFEYLRGAYGLPKSDILAKNLLRSRLEKEGYYETATTPGLWQQKWRPIMFCIIVDDFGVEYVVKQHAKNLAMILKKYHNITEDWTREICRNRTYMGLKQQNIWSHNGRVYTTALSKIWPPKPQEATTISQCTQTHWLWRQSSNSYYRRHKKPLYTKGIKRVQGIVVALLYVSRDLNNKLIMAISTRGTQQATATENKNAAITQLLDYVAT